MIRSKSRRRLLIAGSAALLLGVNLPAAAESTIRVAIAQGGSAAYAHLDAAERLGYFAEAGIRVEVAPYRGGAAALQAMVAGEADIANYYGAGLVVAVSRGVDARIIGAHLTPPAGRRLVTVPSSGISSLAELDGRVVGVSSAGGTNDFLTRRALAQAGARVETVAIGGGAAQVAALRRGDIDALTASATTLALLTQAEDLEIIELADYKDIYPIALSAVWVSSPDYIESHPDRIESFLRESYRAVRYMKAHPEFSHQLLSDFTKVTDTDAIRALFQEETLVHSETARIEREWIEEAIETARLVEMPNVPSVDDVFTDRFAHVGAQ